jgi:hypothetical protein
MWIVAAMMAIPQTRMWRASTTALKEVAVDAVPRLVSRYYHCSVAAEIE